MQAIFTKILPATNTKPTRVKAYCPQGSATLNRNDALNHDGAHRAALIALLHKLNWPVNGWVTGESKEGQVWVFCPPPLPMPAT